MPLTGSEPATFRGYTCNENTCSALLYTEIVTAQNILIGSVRGEGTRALKTTARISVGPSHL